MKRAALALLLCVLLGALLGWAGSAGGLTFTSGATLVGGLPVFGLCIALAFAVQWLAFVPAWFLQTEKFYDLTGSITYLSVVALALGSAILKPGDVPVSPLKIVIALCVAIWALRLGIFLFLRIMRDSKDRRFDAIKSRPARFFTTWTLQGLWVAFTAAAALAAITSLKPVAGFGLLAWLGLLLWLFGFVVEAIADAQKRRFRRDAHAGDQSAKPFIDTGLWALSRHPNYFGEIVLWVGMALMAVPLLQGWQYLTLVSPVFVYMLLTRISGIPLLEQSADARFGDDPRYQRYKLETPVLWPRLP